MGFEGSEEQDAGLGEMVLAVDYPTGIGDHRASPERHEDDMTDLHIRPFTDTDTEVVIALWRDSGLTRPWNDPRRDIERKATTQPELFLVGTVDDEVIATAMVGYDGHRGWVNYLAVAAHRRQHGHARALMAEAERLLLRRGCPKLNLQLRRSNTAALGFYRALGYVEDDAISLGKRLIVDDAGDHSTTA